MSNDYQSTTKPFPDSHMTPAFTPATPQTAVNLSQVETALHETHTQIEEEMDALSVLEASIEKPKTVVTPPPVTAPTLPQSPVLPNFPDNSRVETVVVSQSRPMPELATVAPKAAVAAPVAPEQVRPTTAPTNNVMPTPVHGLSLAEGHVPAARPVTTPTYPSTSQEEGVVSAPRVVTQPSTAAAVTITTITDGVVGTARVVQPGNKNPKVNEGTKETVSLEEPAVNLLQRVINAYTQLEQSIAANKVELDEASARLQAVKEKKHALEAKLHEITPPGLPAPLQTLGTAKDSVMELDALHNEVKESKINTQNRSCDTVIEYAKNIRKHIVGDSAKAEEFLKPLNLSCEILKTNIQHVRTLEQVVELMEAKKSLTHKRNEIHKTINMLMGQIA